MDLLFHTIALEPARWTAQRISQELAALLPEIAAAGFRRLEVYEPHLTGATTSPEIREAFRALELSPEILSSYLNLNPAATSCAEVEAGVERIRERAEYYGFRRVRIFPGPGVKPSDKETVAVLIERLEGLVAGLPGTEILLETHDGSVADDPEAIVRIVREIDAPSIGLLYQPTVFEPEAALRQFALQRPFIRHVHLQNRYADSSFSPLREGVVPWDRIIAQLDKSVTGTLEFVPVGICPMEKFDLGETLAQAGSEAEYIRGLG
jgi:sugar phosphate isomerase/epimerase